jgi:outer membrane lipoprotein-sorting protein
MVSVRAAVCGALILGGKAAAQRDADAGTFATHQAATQTYAADLKQKFHWTFPKRHVESVGQIYYQAPDSLAMILTNPVTELVIVRGQDLYIKRGRNPVAHRTLQIHNGRPTQNVQFLLAFFQNGCTNYAHLFQAQMTQTANTMTVTLVPQHPSQMFPLRKVTNILGWPGLDVQSMRIGLIWDGYITYEFSRGVRNQTVDPAVFNIPKDSP